MKRLMKKLGILCVLLALVLSACAPAAPAEKNVVVTALKSSVQIKDTEVSIYDYTSLFSVTVDGIAIVVQPSFIDDSAVIETPGTYKVTCTYENQTASADVTVVYADYALTLSAAEITLKAAEVAGYNFKALFRAEVDGMRVNIDDAMVTSDVKAEAGDYTYTVSIGDCRETLTVHVVPDHDVEIVLSYALYELPVNEKDGFDPAVLFSLYVDGAATELPADAIDASALANAGEGDEVEIVCSYTFAGFTATERARVKIAEAREIAITARDVVTYPNAAEIDLTSLFTVTYGKETIPVTIDMIEGTIDYSSEGENPIVLRYGGKTATATVTVRRGVIIDYAHADTVTVRVGTDKRTYPFAEDFVVIINGARYVNIPDSYFDLSEADFSEEGEFSVTLTIPYGDKKPTLSGGWPVTEYSKTIKYIVRSAEYSLGVKQDVVELEKGTASYDPFKNLTLVVNGINTAFTDRKEDVDITCVYAEVKTSIDYTSLEDQTVTVAVYVFGAEREPVEISFTVRIKSDLKVEAVDRVAFTGATLYTRDLFSITDGGTPVEVTNEMISGKVDTFKPGIYEVSIEYRGLTATSRVVVYSDEMVGRYKTLLRTIPEEEEDDGEDYGEGGWGYTEGGDDYDFYAGGAMAIAETSQLGDLVITQNGEIEFNGIKAFSVTGVDEHTMFIRTGSGSTGTEYTLHFDDGIIVLDVDNRNRLGFSDYMRPLIYFSETLWTLNETVVINYGAKHVLETDTSGNYSLNTFRITSKEDGSEKWYGLYIGLVLHTSGDTIYEVKWGEVVFDESFSHKTGSSSSLLFDGKTYAFTMEGYSTGKIDRNENVAPYEGKTFTGSIDGEQGRIVAASGGQYSVYKGNSLILRLTSYEVSSMRNGGVLPGDILFFYASEAGDGIAAPCSYKFALDVEHATFTTLERDAYFGKYYRGEQWFFLDGYGTGRFFGGTSTADIAYTAKNGEIAVSFRDVDPASKFGSAAAFYISPLLNVLTVKSSNGLAGDPFVNTIITDGAIVTVSTTMVSGASANAKNQLLSGITIVTANGEVSDSAKSSYVDTSAVNFGKAGFYQFKVTVNVGGKAVESYYAVQVMSEIYDGNPVVGAYPSGVLSPSLSFTVDKSGRAYISVSGVTYMGVATIYEDNSFAVKAYGQDGALLTATGKMLAPGLLEVRFEGALRTADYFTTGQRRVAAGKDGALYEFVTGGQTVYVYAKSAVSMGEVVTAVKDGNSYTLTFADGTSRTADVAWSNTTSGFTFTS